MKKIFFIMALGYCAYSDTYGMKADDIKQNDDQIFLPLAPVIEPIKGSEQYADQTSLPQIGEKNPTTTVQFFIDQKSLMEQGYTKIDTVRRVSQTFSCSTFQCRTIETWRDSIGNVVIGRSKVNTDI
ncbi:MAG: hypothetical protein LBG20_03850 [Holosporaceae bacterium]|nr:hypothetical protein [Holosporaceae bacterium]